jgi:uncharacterized membrane protein
MIDENGGPPPAPLAGPAAVRLFPAALCSVLGISLVLSRAAFTGSREYVALVWNLGLAWVPLLSAYAFARVPQGRENWPKLILLGAVWLLFFPNAPYLVTDLVHLGSSHKAPKWFDACMLFTFAWTGCVLGFLSLSAVHARVHLAAGRTWGWAFVVAINVLTGFGVYLGRFERWNSWDILSEPKALLHDVASVVLNPTDHPRALGFTLQFAALLLAGYATFLFTFHRQPLHPPSRAHRNWN